MDENRTESLHLHDFRSAEHELVTDSTDGCPTEEEHSDVGPVLDPVHTEQCP